ncbi:aminoglycoside phosphotransferase family protein [Candidatus Dojkabacteria bacterium]|nr:aminoglycoside phosphotransferase family protein [Candidatus Dojkabacteria bacterium]
MEDIITEGFSKFLKSPSPPLSINKFDTGLSKSQVFKVAALSTGKKYICKIFPISYKERIKRSTDIDDLLIRYKYPVPKTLFLDFCFTTEFSLLIQEYLEGETFYYRIIDKTVSKKLLHSIAGNLAGLHKLPNKEIWQNENAPCNNNSDWISAVKKWRPDLMLLTRQGIIDSNAHKYFDSKIQELVGLISNSLPMLCPLHWDYNPQNILVKDTNVTAVLDFESHRIGDNHAELGIIMYWFNFYDISENFITFVKQYEKIMNVPVTMEKVRGYYIFHLFSAYSYLIKCKSDSSALAKVKSMLQNSKQITK